MLRSPMGAALVLYDDAELGSIVGDVVVKRDTVAEWPRSWTQRLEFASGRTLAYKASLPPLIESAFYAAAKSPLLPGYQYVGNVDGCDNMLIEWLDSPSLADVELDESELLKHATSVVRKIGEMPQDLPVYLDVGTPEKWSTEANATFDKLRKLISDGTFSDRINKVLGDIESWVLSSRVLDEVAATSRLVHRDLKPDHIFPTDGGYRLIDWQVPAIAPGNVDFVWLLEQAGVDSFPHTDPTSYGIAFFLHLRWAIVAQHDFFPEFTGPLFKGWARHALRALLRTRESS